MNDAALPDRCARCGGPFRCGVSDAGPCPCSTVRLDPAALRALSERYAGCLCVPCLQAAAAGVYERAAPFLPDRNGAA